MTDNGMDGRWSGTDYHFLTLSSVWASPCALVSSQSRWVALLFCNWLRADWLPPQNFESLKISAVFLKISAQLLSWKFQIKTRGLPSLIFLFFPVRKNCVLRQKLYCRSCMFRNVYFHFCINSKLFVYFRCLIFFLKSEWLKTAQSFNNHLLKQEEQKTVCLETC